MSDKKNFFFYLLPSIVAAGVGIAILPITTYFLEPVDFGIYALLSAFVIPVSAFSSTGAMWMLGAHFFKTTVETRKTLLFNILFVDFISKLFWFGVFASLAPIFLPKLIIQYQPFYNFYFILILISILLSALSTSVSSIFVYQRRAKAHGLVEITGPIVSSAATIFCLSFLGLKTISLFIGPLIGEIFSVLLGLSLVWRSLEFDIRKEWIKETVRVGIPTIPLDVMSVLNNIADRYFIQRWLNLSLLGIYAHSLNYKSIFTLGTKSFSRVYSPHIVEKSSKGEDISILQRMLQSWFGVIGIAGLFVIFFSYEIVNMLTHGKFIEAVPLIPIWYSLIPIGTYGLTYFQFLLAHKKNRYLAISGVVITVFSIGITAAGIYAFGLMGGVIAMIFSSFISQYSFQWYARKNGCREMGTKYFLQIMIGLGLFYLLNFYWLPDLSLFLRTGLFMILSIIVAYTFGLLNVLKHTYKKLV